MKYLEGVKITKKQSKTNQNNKQKTTANPCMCKSLEGVTGTINRRVLMRKKMTILMVQANW